MFIGYRRVEGEGGGYAEGIASDLEHRGYASIRDVTLAWKAEDYRARALKVIESVPNFVLVLSCGSLGPEALKNDDDELLVEIRQAIKTKRQIIPVTIDGYVMPPESALPEDIRQVRRIDAVLWHHNDPTAAVDHIISNLRPRPFFGRLWRKSLAGRKRVSH
jgi:hypothetical protein